MTPMRLKRSGVWPGIIRAYREYLPVSENTPVITLQEGATPLIPACWISELVGANVYLKYEGANPTGSFKDRGMTLAITKAVESGSKAVICASTGNTSASAAAYSAKAGIRCVVLIPSGAIALGKLSQAMIHHATVIAVKGNFDEALTFVRRIADEYPITLVNSVNPFRLEGQKTGSFEICEQLEGRAPDCHAIPVGNAGNISAYWKGYKEFFEKGHIKSVPKMLGFQASGAAPIVNKKVIKHPKTLATAIKIGNPASWQLAEAARDQSGGLIDSVTDAQIMAAYKLMARKEGIFAEPASAASVAGILKLGRSGYFKRMEKDLGRKPVVVCILTGHGLKDPDRAILSIHKPKVVPADMKKILRAMDLRR